MSNDSNQRAERAAQMRLDRERSEKRQRNVITLGIIALVLGLIGLAAFAVHSESKKVEASTKLVPPTGANSDYGFLYRAQDAGGKPARDAVRVVLYEDLQCPICQRFESANGEFLERAVKNGEIEIEYRLVHFLDRNGASPNEYSGRASNAVLCTRENGGGKAAKTLHDLLYANQPEERTLGPTDRELLESALSAGAKKSVEPCILKHKFLPWLDKATDAMETHKVQGTPTVRINGKDVTGAMGIPTILELQAAIEAAKK